MVWRFRVEPNREVRKLIAAGLTMRLSDARLYRREAKLLYPDHRLPPWLTEHDTTAIARTVGLAPSSPQSDYTSASSVTVTSRPPTNFAAVL